MRGMHGGIAGRTWRSAHGGPSFARRRGISAAAPLRRIRAATSGTSRLQPRLRHPPLLVRPAIPHQQLADATASPIRAQDRRWVRYYDDAYLIDRDGRVRRRALRHGLGPLWRGMGRWRTASPPIAAAATGAPATRIMPGPSAMAPTARQHRRRRPWRCGHGGRRPWRRAAAGLRPWRGLWRLLRLRRLRLSDRDRDDRPPRAAAIPRRWSRNMSRSAQRRRAAPRASALRLRRAPPRPAAAPPGAASARAAARPPASAAEAQCRRPGSAIAREALAPVLQLSRRPAPRR